MIDDHLHGRAIQHQRMARFVFGVVRPWAVFLFQRCPRRAGTATAALRAAVGECAVSDNPTHSRSGVRATPETTSDPRWRGGCSPRRQGSPGTCLSRRLRGGTPCTRSSGHAVVAGMDLPTLLARSAHYAAEQRRGFRDRSRCGATHRHLGSKLSRLSGRLLNGWALVRIQPVPRRSFCFC